MTPLLSQSLFEAQKLKRRQCSQPWSLLQARSFPHSAPHRGRKAALHLSTAEPQHATLTLRFFHLFASSYFLVTGFFHGFLNNKKIYFSQIYWFKTHSLPMSAFQPQPLLHAPRESDPSQKHTQTYRGAPWLTFSPPLAHHSTCEGWEAAQPSRTTSYHLSPPLRSRRAVKLCKKSHSCQLHSVWAQKIKSSILRRNGLPYSECDLFILESNKSTLTPTPPWTLLLSYMLRKFLTPRLCHTESMPERSCQQK